nr:nucleotide-binding alpha-beta plait domain-containing protein [Tanacetum cinerariifolium]
MGSYRSKEDDVSRISTSIFVTNFPESFSAKDLFHSCKQYGHVVDTFIPLKRSKGGKRFGFVRFINVFNVERLEVGNYRSVNNAPRKDSGFNDTSNSFAHVVKGCNMSGNTESDSTPTIVLDDECLYSKILSNSLLGRVKEFASLSNLKLVLINEGFVDIHIRYMGQLWVLLEFATSKTKDLFSCNVRVGSWFSVLQQSSNDFTMEGRIAWVEIEWVPFKLWSGNTFKRIATKWMELLDIDDLEETFFHSRRLCIFTKSRLNIYESFKIVFRGKMFWIRAKKFPGWIPEIMKESVDEDQSVEDFKGGDPLVHDVGSCGEDSHVEEVPWTRFDESSGQKENLSEDPFEIYPHLNKHKNDKPQENVESSNGVQEQNGNMDENKNGREDNSDNMGSKVSDSDCGCSGRFKKSKAPRTRGLAQKAKKDWVKELCVKYKVNFFALQETKMETMELFTVKLCWGNFAFDYVHSDSIGNSGGDLGVWVKTGVNLLIVVVYAPHDLRDKRILWDYLAHVSNQWDMERMLMGDFNEVAPGDDSTGMRHMMFKLKFLKSKIRDWYSRSKNNTKGDMARLTRELQVLDADMDNGNGSVEVANKRMEVVTPEKFSNFNFYFTV